MLCDCTSNVALPVIGAKRCGVNFGQLQVLAFVKIGDEPVAGESGSLFLKTNVGNKALWEAALAETTPKVVLSPVLYNPTVEAGDARTWGGENATPDGVEFQVGANATTLTAELRNVDPKVAAAMKELRCMAENGQLAMVMFDSDDEVIGADGETAIVAIPVRSLFVSDRVMGNLTEPDYHNLTIGLAPDWSDALTAVALDTPSVWRGMDLLAV